MYTDAAGRTRGGNHSSLYGLSSRATSLSYYRRQLSSLAAAFSSLYPVPSAPPAHQSKPVVPPQPAHQLPPAATSHVAGPGSSLPAPDVSAIMQPLFRIPSATYSGGGSQPPMPLPATGSSLFWGLPHQQTGSSCRRPVLAGAGSGSSTQPGAVDPAMQSSHGGIPLNRPALLAAAAPQLIVPPPMAHRPMPSSSSLPAAAGSGRTTPGAVPPATQYTTTSTHHTMFLARVLVGRSVVGCSEYRTPPPLDPADRYGRCFDSCVNRPIDPSIYVIFNSAQSYPEYVIEYVNKSKSADAV